MRLSTIIFLIATAAVSLPAFALDPLNNESADFSYKRRKKLEKFRLELSAGAGLRFAELTPTANPILQQYGEKLRKGINLSFSGTYFFSDKGVGLIVDNFNSRNRLSPVTVTYPSGNSETGTLRDNINITFYALSYSIRVQNRSLSNTFIVCSGIGLVRYINDAARIRPVLIKGQSFGGSLSLQFDHLIADHWHLGIKATVLSGVLKEATVNGTNRSLINSEENLARGNLSAGLRFTF